jgi:hypothetical protein
MTGWSDQSAQKLEGNSESMAVEVPGVPRPRRVWLLHPWLIAGYPVVALYAQNSLWTRLSEMVLPLVLTTAVALVLWLVLRLALRDGLRAALVTSIVLGTLHASTRVSSLLDAVLYWLSEFWVVTIFETPAWKSVVPLLVLAVLLVYVVVFRLRDVRRLTTVANVFSVVLVAMPLEWAIRHPSIVPPGPLKPLAAPVLNPRPGPDGRPDIYYIVLDGFARADVLKKNFNLDIEPMLGRLERRGFYVARRSTSNYCQTPLSITSSLNGEYLDRMLPKDFENIGLLSDLIGRSTAVTALRNAGYTFVSFATGFDQTEQFEADVRLSPYVQISGFHRMLLADTPLFWRLLPNPMQRDSYTMTRDRTNLVFEKLPEIARDPAPTFTFAHILGPHPPFVFGENGEDVSPHQTRYFLSDGTAYHRYYGRLGYVQGYRSEATYLARRVEQVIEKILADSPRPPVIIFHADHGSGLDLNVESADKTDLHERMSILNAYYFPNHDYRGLDDRITPVNTFRVVFNTLFGAELPRLPDRSYFSTWMAPFDYIDVTDHVRSPDPSPTQVALPRSASGNARPEG